MPGLGLWVNRERSQSIIQRCSTAVYGRLYFPKTYSESRWEKPQGLRLAVIFCKQRRKPERIQKWRELIEMLATVSEESQRESWTYEIKVST